MTLKGYIYANKLRFFFITLLAIIAGLGGVSAGYIQMYWLTYIKDRAWVGAGITTGFMLISWLAAQSVIYYVLYLNNVQEEQYFKKIRDQIAEHYFKDGKNHKVADFQNRMTNDFTIIKNNFFAWYPILLFYGSLVISSVIALITIHWLIFILSLIVNLISYFLPKLISKRLEKATINVSDKNKAYLDAINKWFSGLNELRRYFAGDKLLQVQAKASRKLENANINQTVQQQLLNILNGVGLLLMTITLPGITGVLVTQKLVIFGAILAVQEFAYNGAYGIKNAVQALILMRSTKKLMNEIARDAENISNETDIDDLIPIAFEIHNLVLDFPNGESLKYPDIKVNKGEKILLTGDSGSGKTTLFKLILGEIKPSQGQVRFEDDNGNQVETLKPKIGYIPQDPNLFPGTIEQNITMFNDQLNNEVKSAVKDVDLAKDLVKFPAGLDTKLNLDKLNISGGQRQKIVLARSEIHDNKIILIDEGTSAIDQTATMNILKNILQSNATIVFIAHNFNEKMCSLFDREIKL